MSNYRNFRLVYYFVAQAAAHADRERLEKDIAFFEKYMRVDKVYLEPYRGGVLADEAHLKLCRDAFEAHGVEVAGGLTTTMPTPEGAVKKQRLFDTCCYNDPVMLAELRKASAYTAAHFDEYIIDDFFFLFDVINFVGIDFSEFTTRDSFFDFNDIILTIFIE